MKRIILITLTLLVAQTLMAQRDGHQPPERQKHKPATVEELITDLSPSQKTRIDIITRRTQQKVEAYRQQLNNVRDSIRTYTDCRDDNSDILFPLYEREGMLQAEISKEYYRSKVAIDEVLTPKQYADLKEKMEKERAQRKNNKPDQPPSPR